MTMRPEGGPLDLNNLPEEYGKQAMEESSTTTATSTETTRFKKKKSGGKEGRDESGKVYECRFCSLKFCKSQALGGHMNRHRQERETETLNRARQLVFSNESHMGFRDVSLGGGGGSGSAQPMPSGCFQHGGGAGDPCLHFRPVYPRLPTPYQPPPSSSHPFSYPPSPPPHHHPSISDFYMGRVLAAGTSHTQPHNMSNNTTVEQTNHTCFGASFGQSTTESVRAAAVSRDAPRTGGGDWNFSYGFGKHSDPSSIDRFPDDF